jgi:hypothetical protein
MQPMSIRTEEFEINWKDVKLLKPEAHEKISHLLFTNYRQMAKEYREPNEGSQNDLLVKNSKDGAWEIQAKLPEG